MNGSLNVEIIAEVAQGYQGSSLLVDLFVSAFLHTGANALKFQLIYADELATKDYQYYELFKSLELQDTVWANASKRVQERGKKIYFDVFGDHSLKVAMFCQADGVKISTTEFYNRRLLKNALANFDTVLISTGGISEVDLDEMVQKDLKGHEASVILLHGFQSEPTPLVKSNLLKMASLKRKFPNFKIGYMDHTDGGSCQAIDVPLMALGVGMDAIEKHLTLDRSLELEDFVSGVSPEIFKMIVDKIRDYQPALGEGSLDLTSDELEYFKKAVKVAVASRDIVQGEPIKEDDFTFKRTSASVTTDNIIKAEDIIYRTAAKSINCNEPVMKGDLWES